MNFIKAFTFLSIIFLSLLVGLVVSVDPYDKLGNNPWGFETKAVAQSRENKFILFENSKVYYKNFLLGSSAAHRFPMNTLKELTGGDESFNYSAQHTTPEDYLAIIRHILDRRMPSRIFLQIGFAELNKNYKTDNRLYNSSLFKYLRQKKKDKTLFDNNYFTLNAIGDSFRVIFVNNFGKALHNKYVLHGDYIKEKNLSGEVKVQQASYVNWELSEKRVEILREIRNLCSKNNIELTVFVAPLAYKHYKKAVEHPEYKSYLGTLINIFGGVWNFHSESISKYNDARYFRNSTHMSREFSEILLKRMLSSGYSELGEFQTSI